jgi:hypothetical protein
MLSKTKTLGFIDKKNCGLLTKFNVPSKPIFRCQRHAFFFVEIFEFRSTKCEIRVNYWNRVNSTGFERAKSAAPATKLNEGFCFFKVTNTKRKEADEGWLVYARI